MPRSTAPADDSQARFKSRFSLLSLLPSRHPPLHIDHPQPFLPSQFQDRVPRQDVPSHHLTTVISSRPRIVSQYASPLTCYPETPALPSALQNERGAGSSPDRGRRPPPTDLGRIRAAYPTEKAINDIPLTPPTRPRIIPPAASPPILPPFPLALRKEKEAQKKAAARRPPPSAHRDSNDPFDIVCVEPGHRYDSWQGGKVDIRPGEVIPRGLVGSYLGSKAARRETRTIRGERPEEVEEQGGEQYDSVLQHVLLTPTYLRASPSSTHHTIHNGNRGRRETMMDKARRMSRAVPALLRRDDPAGKAVRPMREREEQEMNRFRRTQGMVLGSTSSIALNRDGGSPVPKERRSPGWAGEREARGGYERGKYEKREYRDVKGGAPYAVEEGGGRRGCWGKKRSKEELEKMPTWRKMYLKYRILIAILVIVGAAISLAAVLLTRRSSISSSTPSPSSESNSTSTLASSSSISLPSSASGTLSAPVPTFTSRTLQSCLDNLLSPNSGYSCSDCTPLLLSTTNDFTTPLVNGNSTGVGAALQYCTLLDVMSAGNRTGFEGLGWTGKGSCTWNGVKCDARGRVTELSLTYPNVPYRFPTTIGQIPTLTVVRIKGNSSVPAGPFPSAIISPSLVTLDISDTALQGPIAQVDFSRAAGLTTLYLANNPILGSSLPDLRTNGRLLTLAATGQLLSNVTEANLPSSLTYLDLSFNALRDQVPSFSSLTGLKTLYLESNQFSSPPTSFPTGISDLKLTNNPSLRGSMPSVVCGNTGLSNCDLRNTGLGGAANGTAATNGTRSCGRCLF